eukprot:GHVN01007124.1.p1 GENE.GHVN01007124.1~~GHVN01007124.1.p1  ORF type:complete len:991 (+),score=91.46 GHVN01007124.1:438-2975(+)
MTGNEAIALTAMFVLPNLLLQRPHPKAKTKECSGCLLRRIEAWKEGKLMELFAEGRAIQQRLPERAGHEDQFARQVAALVAKGNVGAATSRCTRKAKGGVLQVTPTVRLELEKKHPCAVAAVDESLIPGEPPPVGLCEEIALFAKRLATEHLDPQSLAPFLSSRLIPLNKDPGVRPVGVGEVLRRMVGKMILITIKDEAMEAAGSRQTCMGLPGGCEAAVHALKEVFEEDETDAVLLVDADNAFNRLNRQAALLNIRHVCPSVSTAMTNVYRSPGTLFLEGGDPLVSDEGTTQGCPFGMMMYGLAVKPLIDTLESPSAEQMWFADDAAAGGSLVGLRQYWDTLTAVGPRYGYFAKPSKSYLIVKPGRLELALEVFKNTGLQITADGCDGGKGGGERHLGAAIGSDTFIRRYLDKLVGKWSDQITLLADIAATHPHAAFATYVHGVRHGWTFAKRTIPNFDEAYLPVSEALRNKLVSALVGHSASDTDYEWLTLPIRFGGKSLSDPMREGTAANEESRRCTAPLARLIRHRNPDEALSIRKAVAEVQSLKRTISKERTARLTALANTTRSKLSPHQQRAMDCARQKGGSAIFSAIPVEAHGFYFPAKNDLRDAFLLHHHWPLTRLPERCACGSQFNIDHAQVCMKGGFIAMRHDDPVNTIATACKKVFNDVEIEPQLQPLTGERLNSRLAIRDAEARADIRVNGFWTRGQNAFFDMRVFYPFAKTHVNKSHESTFRGQENEKKRQYAERIREVDHGSFTPLVFSSTGGSGKEASVVLSRLANLIAEREGTKYSLAITRLRTSLSFSLARSAIRCVRGSRIVKPPWRQQEDAPADLVATETRMILEG